MDDDDEWDTDPDHVAPPDSKGTGAGQRAIDNPFDQNRRHSQEIAAQKQQTELEAGKPPTPLPDDSDKPMTLTIEPNASLASDGAPVPATFTLMVVPALLIGQLCRKIAEKLGELESDGETFKRELLLVEKAGGALLNASHTCRDSGLKDGDVVIVQSRAGPWRKQHQLS